MKQKLSQIPAPAIAGVVREKSSKAAIAEIKNCVYGGADMIDLHLSCLEDKSLDTLKHIIEYTQLPILALNYNTTYEWGNLGMTEEEREELFLRAIDAGAMGIDMQGYTFHAPSKTAFYGENKYSFTRDNPKEVVTDEATISRQCELIEKVHAKGAEVLLSCHPGVSMKADQVVDLALFLEKRNPDIIKLVTVAKDEEDLAESIRAMLLLKKEVKTPVAYHANGQPGFPSRIINPLLGGQIAFCVDRFSDGSTLEQIDLRTARAVVDGVKKIQ